MKKFPLMGFDPVSCTATIYDSGTTPFTGTTLSGIGQSVVGILSNPSQTANRFVKIFSIRTCQNELLAAYEKATGKKWSVRKGSSRALMESGKKKFREGDGGWVLELVVGQMFDDSEAGGKGRCVVAETWEESDGGLLGLREESAEEVVGKVLHSFVD